MSWKIPRQTAYFAQSDDLPAAQHQSTVITRECWDFTRSNAAAVGAPHKFNARQYLLDTLRKAANCQIPQPSFESGATSRRRPAHASMRLCQNKNDAQRTREGAVNHADAHQITNVAGTAK